ncbi:DEKNAAC104513 [Brettanomyces naardenensis]|uniref:DEKNAAC104513 n=1 Tax=Brettanomyces naardenensis TaxID=13370 RepID=A0A448YQZ9_BRENA|nr:DEKNAAC104513 [Brettanomyces naardenensis]
MSHAYGELTSSHSGNDLSPPASDKNSSSDLYPTARLANLALDEASPSPSPKSIKHHFVDELPDFSEREHSISSRYMPQSNSDGESADLDESKPILSSFSPLNMPLHLYYTLQDRSLPQIPQGSRIASLSAAAELDVLDSLGLDLDLDLSDSIKEGIDNGGVSSELSQDTDLSASIPGTPRGFRSGFESNFEMTNDDAASSTVSSNITHKHSGQTMFYNVNNGSDSTVSVLPTDASFEMYRKNARKTKDPEVLFSFARMLIKGAILGSKDKDSPISNKMKQEYLDEAFLSLKRACRSGLLDAQYFLGDAYSVGLFSNGKPDNHKALGYFESAGKGRHAESAYRTALCYRKGWGCTPDSRKVVKFIEIAAMNGHPVAMMEYGIYLFNGLMGLPEDVNTKKKGISWLKRATEVATELSCGAPYELAMIYLHGFKDIVIKDTKYAVKLLFQAANLGHAKSAALLGRFYEIGDPIESNSDLSIHFYNMAAELGDPIGMMGLCSWYFVGTERLAKDYDEAFAWAQKAADLGDTRAMLSLHRFYEMGLGCDRDPQKAQFWEEKAEKSKSKKKRWRS